MLTFGNNPPQALLVLTYSGIDKFEWQFDGIFLQAPSVVGRPCCISLDPVLHQH